MEDNAIQTTEEVTNQLMDMDTMDSSEDAGGRESMVELMPRSVSPTDHSPSTPHFSDGDASDWDEDLRRVIQRNQDDLEHLNPHLYDLEFTDRSTDDPSKNPAGVRPEWLPPALFLFHHDTCAAPQIVQHAHDFPPSIHTWLRLNLFNNLNLGFSLQSLLVEYEEYTESTVHWSAVLEIGKSLLLDAYVYFEHQDVDWDMEPTLNDLEDAYRGPSRTQAEFDSRVRLWEFKVQIWQAVMEFAEREDTRGSSQEVRECETELVWEEFNGIFRPWSEDSLTLEFTNDTQVEHTLPLSRGDDWAYAAHAELSMEDV